MTADRATEQLVRDTLSELAERAPTVASVGRAPAPGMRRRSPLLVVAAALVVVAIAAVAVVIARRDVDSPQQPAGLGGSQYFDRHSLLGTPSASTSSDDDDVQSAWTHPELAAAKAIPGVVWKAEPDHDHTTGAVHYDTSPPTGGNHNPIWALCDGVVYDHQIANENAVHMLEHGAIWITYNPKTISAADLATLNTLVNGVNYLALSPYAGLRTPISLQAWGYQLFLQKANDKRIDEFISALKYPSVNTPEPGAGCTGSGFIAADSTLGHPYSG